MKFQFFKRKSAPEQWADRVVSSYKNMDPELPGFPDEGYQQQTVGATGSEALQEAANFYLHVRKHAEVTNARILDFGCGWGRLIRFFTRDTSHLEGVDVDPFPLAECIRTGVNGNFTKIEPAGVLPFGDSSFDIVCSYSVFSHLPENLATHWVSEIARVLRPGGFFIFTANGLFFLRNCKEIKDRLKKGAFATHLIEALPEPEKEIHRYKSGQFVYGAAGGGGILDPSIYGWASIPKSYIESNWKKFSMKDAIEDPYKFPQSVFTMTKIATDAL